MSDLLDLWPLWFGFSLITLASTSFFGRHVENQYRREFGATTISARDSWASLALTGVLFTVFAVVVKDRLLAITLLPWSIAAAVLHSIWRIDRVCLLIPDRLQALGTSAGIFLVLLLILTGESYQDILLSTGLGLSLVAFLWLLSFAYLKLRGTIGFGFGDVKLLAWLALFVGRAMSDLILLAIAFGLLHLAFQTVRRSLRDKKLTLPGSQDAFAFGPSIIAAFATLEITHYA